MIHFVEGAKTESESRQKPSRPALEQKFSRIQFHVKQAGDDSVSSEDELSFQGEFREITSRTRLMPMEERVVRLNSYLMGGSEISDWLRPRPTAKLSTCGFGEDFECVLETMEAHRSADLGTASARRPSWACYVKANSRRGGRGNVS